MCPYRPILVSAAEVGGEESRTAEDTAHGNMYMMHHRADNGGGAGGEKSGHGVGAAAAAVRIQTYTMQ